MIAALDNGQVDITHVSTPFLIRAVLDGSDAVAIAAEFANPIYSLVGRPGLGIEDLRGKTVGLAAAADMVGMGVGDDHLDHRLGGDLTDCLAHGMAIA